MKKEIPPYVSIISGKEVLLIIAVIPLDNLNEPNTQIIQ